MVQQYAERTRDAAQWKESKAQAIAVALREYQASQEIFRPSHYLRFRSVKILLETNLDYLRCQKSGEFVTLRLSESEAACARWKIFASERMKLLSPSQAATRLTQAPLTESIGYAWISDRIESYLNRLHSATDVAAVPVTSLLSNLEKFCASDNYPASQAKCLIQYYDQEVRELDGRLKAGTQAIDLAFDELSSELASQVRAP
ncbi:MAG: hypothetical protein EOP09_19565 [Proteobacteria bacterium]|nr:MAG: hypothetical protein EOP09_19565 [Pseudomonadota bacterium]